MKYFLSIAFSILYVALFGQTNTFPASGNVGIGTTSPAFKLTVEGEINVSRNYPYIQFTSSYWGGAYSFVQSGVTHAALANGNYTVLYNPSSKGFNFRQGEYDALTIVPDGKIGIGTINPRGKLDVDGPGDIYLSDDPINGTGQSIFLPGHVYLSPHASTNNVSYIQARRSDNSGSTAIRFRTYNNGSLIEAMHLESSGNVGIGTVSPGSYKLAVEGKIGAREVNVTTTAWADHVFHKDYQLRSLFEVKKFISENHHLPDVPSETEVLKNGQNLGEMNVILLKKIEELTLYMLEQNRINLEQMNQLGTLSAEVIELRNKLADR